MSWLEGFYADLRKFAKLPDDVEVHDVYEYVDMTSCECCGDTYNHTLSVGYITPEGKHDHVNIEQSLQNFILWVDNGKPNR